MKTKVCKDGFVWLVINKEAAYQLFSSNIEVFRLYDDDSEAACDNANDVRFHNGEFGIEVGFVKGLLPFCPKCGNWLVPSRNPKYTWECLGCGENFNGDEIGSHSQTLS